MGLVVLRWSAARTSAAEVAGGVRSTPSAVWVASFVGLLVVLGLGTSAGGEVVGDGDAYVGLASPPRASPAAAGAVDGHALAPARVSAHMNLERRVARTTSLCQLDLCLMTTLSESACRHRHRTPMA